MKDFADKIGLMVLFLILFLPFLGSLCAAFLPSNARNAEAWLAGSVALAVTGLVASLYPQVARAGVVHLELTWLPALGLDFSLRMDAFAWLFALNGLVYLSAGLIGGHVRRDLLPARDQLTPRHLAREIADHARLRFPASRRYNVLQKLTYLAVIFVLLPMMVLTGLSMSPGMNAGFPWLPELFGGRQSARTLHFISASLIVLFVLVHLAMVLASGPLNSLRAMITGKYAVAEDAR